MLAMPEPKDEFFSEFMPDADRGRYCFCWTSHGETGFNLKELSSDPFAALSQSWWNAGKHRSRFIWKWW